MTCYSPKKPADFPVAPADAPSHRTQPKSTKAVQPMVPTPVRSPKMHRGLALSKPLRDARDGVAHFRSRTRIGKTDERTAVNRIEIDAGGCGNVRLFQHLLRKLETVGGEIRDVGVEIKRAV